MDIEFTGTYKSLSPFTWRDVPRFVVLTGPNGSGKTQLLQLLHGALARRDENKHDPAFDECAVQGVDADPTEIHFLPDRWELVDPGDMGVAQIQGINQNLFKQFERYLTQPGSRRNLRRRLRDEFARVEKKHGDSSAQLNQEELLNELPDDIVYDETQIFNQHISAVYYSYFVRSSELKLNGATPEAIRSEIGAPPWEVVDALLRESRLPFELNNPSQGGLLTTFSLRVTHRIHGTPVRFSELSSGEKILLSLVFFLFNSRHVGLFPKVLLLDEPDAHLHPAMTKQFLDVVHNVLVETYGVRVLVTTHSPSTVALSPDGSLFEIVPGSSKPQLCRSKNHAIDQLTEGIVTVLPGAKYVLVESGDDADFCNVAHDFLMKNRRLNADCPLVFISAADKKNSGGGKGEVEKWANKLADSGLDRIVQGLRDSDSEEVKSPYIQQLRRHSLENYLLDPLLVYGVLLDRAVEFAIDGLDFVPRGFQSLLWLDSGRLQRIADAVHDRVEVGLSQLAQEEQKKTEITVLLQQERGDAVAASLVYPLWLLNRRGKDLLRAYQDVFEAKHLNRARLLQMFRTLQVVPNDLESVFVKLQA